MTILRWLVVGTAVVIGGGYVVGHLAGERDGLRWPLRARAERMLERAQQRGARIGEKTSAAADRLSARATIAADRIADRATVAATRIGEKAAGAATRISHKTSVAATKIGEKTTVAATTVERTVNETALSAKVKAKMTLDDRVKAHAIDVSTRGTTVTLSGTVTSNAERARAVELARETAGVTRVIDELRIR